MHQFPDTGWVEAIIGPMYCGKSEELIRRVRRAEIARQKIQVFKPQIDDRYNRSQVASHDGKIVEAIPVDHPEEILERLEKHRCSGYR